MRSVLVTGATRGLGRAIANNLSSDSVVWVGGRDAAAVQAVCTELPGAQPFVADLADEQATAEAASRITELDAVVHNAALLGAGDFVDVTRQQWREVFEVNVFAVADLTRLLLPQLTASRGTIVAINSGAGWNAHGPCPMYSATKFALRALTDSLREELRPNRIRVCSIHPGRAATDMQRELRDFEQDAYTPEQYLTPESVAQAVRFALSSDESSTIESVSIRPAGR